jgi:pyridoxamine 5'-phosphate oxidase
MALDPIRKFSRWWRDAERQGSPLPEATALATVDLKGRPSVRYVLLKGVDARGFLFYTNEASRKGRDLQAFPEAALAFYWHEPGRQVRVEGAVSLLGDDEADAYWQTRPRGSQIASSVSRQSSPLASRRELVARFRALERRLDGKPVPRPKHWRGYVLDPRQVEFWTRREPRLHDRELFVRGSRGWSRRLLQP